MSLAPLQEVMDERIFHSGFTNPSSVRSTVSCYQAEPSATVFLCYLSLPTMRIQVTVWVCQTLSTLQSTMNMTVTQKQTATSCLGPTVSVLIRHPRELFPDFQLPRLASLVSLVSSPISRFSGGSVALGCPQSVAPCDFAQASVVCSVRTSVAL